ncbi:MAG: magnesium transporter [Cyanobacteria bacterium SW_12_48_29]|nr:MAG: magnesium transporter [Cyanobacteria bacterium QS_5_48_63]PSO86973.1 MAG: magnesium transporter [Cyanobacteria bacterium QS_3_48_167]PSO89067.1 MAG: magnesium transporter [Cyanobacteria bacterium QS_6_48_18]PSP01974.1 MAG: magnesium transporter [Cyanobacteria bacterium SW_12_48_29]PSP03155.1 MAG: magnesium transporter [Cyanobacteria bacterium SW_7_48_12]PSP09987.1 MAG: magnesium transporter [Cyanobacteria bacterium SW_10_48_33]
MSENPSYTSTTSREELRQLVRDQLQTLLEQGNFQGAKSLLVPVQPVDVAEAIEELPESMQVIAFRLLSKNEAIEVYEQLDSAVQQALIQEFKRQEVIEVVDNMSPDDRAKLFDELPAKVVRRLLAQLSPKERQATAQLLGYQEDTAGRIMTPEYISLKENITVAQALEQIRSLANVSEIIYYLYVTDVSRSLTGIVSLRDLVVSSPETSLSEIVTREVVSVHTDTDQEEVARLIQRYDLLALPVVDREQRLVGIVTVDDMIDILEQEATEDIYALGGVQTDGDNYFQTNLVTVARKRVVWLLILLLTNSVTSKVIQSQESLLQEVVVLTAFIPLLIGTGGNVGAQSSTVVIRGLNTDEIPNMGTIQVIVREGMAGAVLGLMLGSLTTLWAYWLQRDLLVALSVGLSLVVIAILASVAGSALPFLFRFLSLDPALMSAPFITTAVDVLGVLIYFNIARIILGI